MIANSCASAVSGARKPKRASSSPSRERTVNEPEAGGKTWIVLLGIWIAAAGLRLLYLWQTHNAPFFDMRLGDAGAYHQWARRIAEGDWVGDGAFYQAPLYPYLLAILYRLVDDSVMTVRVLQALLGAGSCVLLATAGISLFGRLGAVAGVGLAIYPAAIFLDGLLEKSALVTFLTAALLALLALPPDRMASSRWLAAGFTLGLLALARENALILVLPILGWIAFGSIAGNWGQRANRALLLVGACALILLPVGLRNLVVAGEFHLTTSQFGPNFFIGNNSEATGKYQPLVVGHGSAADEREDATRLAEQASGRKLSAGEVSRYWTGRSADYIRSRPLDWLKLTARKVAIAFNATEAADSESQDIYAERSSLLRMLRPFDFGLLFGLAALGAALTAQSWRRVWFLYAVGIAYAASVILFYVFARYRFPLVPVLLLLAAGGAVEARRQWRLRRFRPLAVGGALAVITVCFAHLPIGDSRTARATHFFNIATELSKDPARQVEAMGFFQRALEADPDSPPARAGLGTVLVAMGQPEEALPHYRAAVATWPDYEEARYNFGVALRAAGRTQEAVQEFSQALGARPDDVEARIALANELMALKQIDSAVEHYRRVLASDPRHIKALVGLGGALAQLGRPEEAIASLRLALDIDPQNASALNNLGGTLAGQGRFAEAAAHLERAVAFNPADANAQRNLERVRQILAGRPGR